MKTQLHQRKSKKKTCLFSLQNVEVCRFTSDIHVYNWDQNIILETELAESSFLCRFRIESVNVFVLPPAQYSYDLTVNSFGKAFAHVRNCLLMKKAYGTNRNVGEQKHKIYTSGKKWTNWKLLKHCCIYFAHVYPVVTLFT
jgi:hypothetical protein